MPDPSEESEDGCDDNDCEDDGDYDTDYEDEEYDDYYFDTDDDFDDDDDDDNDDDGDTEYETFCPDGCSDMNAGALSEEEISENKDDDVFCAKAQEVINKKLSALFGVKEDTDSADDNDE